MLSQRFGCAAVIFVILLCVVLIIFASATFLLPYSGSFYSKISNYERARRYVFEMEMREQIGGKVALSDGEILVDELLMGLKYSISKSRNVNDDDGKTVNYTHWYGTAMKSSLYGFLESMPKAVALNVHDMALCKPERLLELSYTDSLWICINENETHEYNHLKFARIKPVTNSSCAWMLLKTLRDMKGQEFVDKKLLQSFSLSPDAYANRKTLLSNITKLSKFIEGMVTYKPVWDEYFYTGILDMINQQILYLEITTSFPVLYDLDDRKYTKWYNQEFLHSLLDDLKFIHEGFVGLRFIYLADHSELPLDNLMKNNFEIAYEAKSLIPHHFAGFVIGGLNDVSITLRQYAHKLLYSGLHLDIYYNVIFNRKSLQALTEQNLMDAALIKFKRISFVDHLMSHPEVLRHIKVHEIGIEITPSLLEFTSGTSGFQPSSIIFANGFSVVLTAPFASYCNFTSLTYEYYLALLELAPDLSGLALVKQLILNSIEHNSMTPCQRHKTLLVWHKYWDNWIKDIIKEHKLM